jgi:ribosomal protein S18 acetylase RimI-like enzyme
MKLDRVSQIQLHPVFQKAFSDYAMDMSALTEERLHVRCVKNGVDWDVSVGAFDGERMVGFTLIGIDAWQGGLGAFDAATGIEPAYRGQGLARAMFEHALPKLKVRGVEAFVLEVLKDNERAIRAYEKARFEIRRELKCFQLQVARLNAPDSATDPVPIRPVDRRVVVGLAEFVDWRPSWENSFRAIERIPDELVAVGAFAGDVCIGAAVYTPVLNWIMTVVVQPRYRRRGVGRALIRRLVEALPERVEAVRLHNVDGSDSGMVRFLSHLGFEPLVDQYEMIRPV